MLHENISVGIGAPVYCRLTIITVVIDVILYKDKINPDSLSSRVYLLGRLGTHIDTAPAPSP